MFCWVGGGFVSMQPTVLIHKSWNILMRCELAGLYAYYSIYYGRHRHHRLARIKLCCYFSGGSFIFTVILANPGSSGLPLAFPLDSDWPSLQRSDQSAFLTYQRPLRVSDRYPLTEEIVRGKAHVLKCAVLDVRPRKALHVTSTCTAGHNGGSCGATHCSLSAGLPLQAISNAAVSSANSPSFQEDSDTRTTRNSSWQRPVNDLDITALDHILNEVDTSAMDQKTTTEWKSSFHNIQGKFRKNSQQFDSPSTGLQIGGASAILDLLRRQSETNAGFGTLPRAISNASSRDNIRYTSPPPYSHNSLPHPGVAKSSSQQDFHTLDHSRVNLSDKAQFWNRSIQTPLVENETMKQHQPYTTSTTLPAAIKHRQQQENNKRTSPSVSSVLWASGAKNRPSDTIRELNRCELDFDELNAVVSEGKYKNNTDSGSKIGLLEGSKMGLLEGSKMGLLESAVARKVESVEKDFDSRQLSHKLAYSDYNPYKDRVRNNVAHACVPTIEIDQAISKIEEISNDMNGRQSGLISDSIEVNLINEVSDFLHNSADILDPNSIDSHVRNKKAITFSELNRLVSVTGQKSPPSGDKWMKPVQNSPSPDALSTSSDTPIGLPYLKPKHHLREQLHNVGIEPRSPTGPVRAGLWMFPTHTGSVAERVMQFEKYPSPIHTIHVQQTDSHMPDIHQISSVIKTSQPSNHHAKTPEPAAQGTPVERRHHVTHARPPPPCNSSPVRPGALQFVYPRFYFPNGRPGQDDHSLLLSRASAVFQQQPDGQITLNNIQPLIKACDLPLYWKRPVFLACDKQKRGKISFVEMSNWWMNMMSLCHDEASRFVYTLANSPKASLEKDHFMPLIQDVVDTFPGLYFLREAPEFHSRYVQTVIARIFYNVNRSWSGRITAAELRKSNFLQVLRSLETVDDINLVTDYFSYEHFYVIYCKFWELDSDHDLFIDKADLARHENAAITNKVIDRIFSGAVRRGRFISDKQRMSYPDFVYFLLAEEDKTHPTSIEYWFRILDLDGDGILSLDEIHQFYTEIVEKIRYEGIEPIAFEDVLCSALDALRPFDPSKVRLRDLKRSKLASNFLNTFINHQKYLEQEAPDGQERAQVKNECGETFSDWERYCAEEYELLMQEEQQPNETEINVDDSDGEIDPPILTLSDPTNNGERSSFCGSTILNTL